MSQALVLHRGSVGLDPDTLVPGRDLVIDPAPGHGLALAHGCALDDYLDASMRRQADRDASERLAAWIRSRTPELGGDGIALPYVLEVELAAQAFLPAARLVAGLPAALEAAGRPSEVRAAGLGDGLLGVASVACDPAGARVVSVAGAGRVPEITRGRVSLPTRLLAHWGAPPRVRGSVLCVPYWSLDPLTAALAESGPSPVAYGLLLPRLQLSRALWAAARHGWLGHPSARARERGRADAARLVSALGSLNGDPFEGVLDAAACNVVARLGGDALAVARHAHRAFQRGRPRLVVSPFDSPESIRALLPAAREAGASTLVVQHGFDAGLNDPDKTGAEHVAVWSERERRRLEPRAGGRLEVTGNPGAAHLERALPRAGGDYTVVLVEYPSRLSVQIDARVRMRHVQAALHGLARARPGSRVIVRPHPVDREVRAYAELAPPELQVEVDAATPIEALLAPAELCVGALSTATLQAGALGVPSVFLDVTDAERPWPFDGAEGALPRVGSADELAAVVGSLRAEAIRACSLEALGARQDAPERVLELVRHLADG